MIAAMLTPSLLAGAQTTQQSYLRNTPSDIEREDPRVNAIIARAEEHFKLGKLNLNDQKRQAAREEFDKAVDAVLESGMDVRSNPKLQRYYLELVERVYREEVPQGSPVPSQQGGANYVNVAQTDGQMPAPAPQVGFVEQKFEPSPLDELSKVTLNARESNVSDREVADAEQVKNTLDFDFKLHPLVVGYINYYQGRGRGTIETGPRRSR